MVLRSIKDRTRLKFNVAIAEVDAEDAWQQAVLGFAVVANERRFVESMVEKVIGFIDQLAIAKLIDDEKDFIVYGDSLSQENVGGWEPDPKPTVRRR